MQRKLHCKGSARFTAVVCYFITDQAQKSTCMLAHTCTQKLKSAYKMASQSGQSLSRVRLFATPWIAARQASLSITNSRSSLRLTSIESVMPSSHLILGRPLLLLPPIPPSISVFSNESTLRMRWPKDWSFRFSIIRAFPVAQQYRVYLQCRRHRFDIWVWKMPRGVEWHHIKVFLLGIPHGQRRLVSYDSLHRMVSDS